MGFRRRGRLSVMEKVSYFDDLSKALDGVEFVQESVPEVLEIKQSMVEQIDAANTHAIVCSSTSGMNISDIAGQSEYPERYIGGHPFNPPHLISNKEKLQHHNITFCTGVKCYFKGMPVLLESLQQELGIRPGETTLDGKFTLKNSTAWERAGLPLSF